MEAQISMQGKPFNTFPVATALKLKPSDACAEDVTPSSPKEKQIGPGRKTVMINFAGKKFRKYPFVQGKAIVLDEVSLIA